MLGIDIGTGSCKCTVLDAGGKLIGQASKEYNTLGPKQGWMEIHPNVWYESAADCLKKIEADSSINLLAISAVGVTGQMRSPTFLDGSDGVVRPSILWNDQRCETEVQEIKRTYAEPLGQITHNPMNTMCTLPKLLWVQCHEPENWKKTNKLLYSKDYINFRLTGNYATDHSDASGSTFYDVEQQTWSDTILNDWHIPKNILPEIHPSTSVIGTITKEAHDELGLKQGIPVAAGGSDTTLEMMAVGIEDKNHCKVRLGTAGGLSTVVDSLDDLEGTGSYVWSFLIPGLWMIDSNTRACADSTVWLKDVFYKDCATSREAYETIDREAGKVAAGSNDLFFHPYLLGEDAPYWQPYLRGSFVGLARSHTRAHIARAVLEGTGYALKDAQAVHGRLVDGFKEYVVIGGGTRNKTWLQIVADILGVDCSVSEQADSVTGAAMLAGVASGVFSGLKQATEICCPIDRKIEHNSQTSKVYNRLFERYRQIKTAMDVVY